MESKQNYARRLPAGQAKPFNRTSMESKLDSQANFKVYGGRTFNRTSMESKLILVGCMPAQQGSFNRTSMESKLSLNALQSTPRAIF